MINVISDSASIYFLLEQKDIPIKDFSKDWVIGCDDADTFYLIMYNSATKKLRAFFSEDHLQNNTVFPEFIEMFQNMTEDNVIGKLAEKAIRIIEDKMYSKNNSRLYFDGH
jgi:hypothetical protein